MVNVDLGHIILVIIIIVFCYGYIINSDEGYKFSDVNLEKSDLDHSERYDSIKIIFSIQNNADLTLTPKIEVKLNESCFGMIADKEMDEIPPKQSVRSYITVSLISNPPKRCVGKKYQITLYLKDVSGKELDKEIVSLGII